MKFINQSRNVNPSVTFSGNVKFTCSVIWEFLEERNHSLQIIERCLFIVAVNISSCIVAVPDSLRRFEVNNMGVLIPTVDVGFKGQSAFDEFERAFSFKRVNFTRVRRLRRVKKSSLVRR